MITCRATSPTLKMSPIEICCPRTCLIAILIKAAINKEEIVNDIKSNNNVEGELTCGLENRLTVIEHKISMHPLAARRNGGFELFTGRRRNLPEKEIAVCDGDR